MTEGPGGGDLLAVELEAGGRAEIAIDRFELPVEIEDRSGSDRALFIGHDAVPAPGSTATVMLRDRHGFSLGDVDSDGFPDLFQVVGGIRGHVSEPPFLNQIQDRLSLGDGSAFTAVDAAGLVKGDCRGREAATLDINADSVVDLFMGCEDGPAVAFFGRGDGTFRREVIPRSAGSSYRWFQLDRGGRPELAIADNRLRVIVRRPGRWQVLQRMPLRNRSVSRRTARSLNHPNLVQAITLGDFDRDGDADMFAASRQGSSVLLNRGGRLSVVSPRKYGLPLRSVAGTWVDVRNDGRLDLHLVPQGWFAGKARGFRRTGHLSRPGRWATLHWADLDNDGRRDLIETRASGRFSVQHQVEARRNRTSSGGWLAVDLPPEAEGARVRARSGRRLLTAWAGQSDDAPASQGHSRLYFGFGDRRRGSVEIVVRWVWGGRSRSSAPMNSIARIDPP